MSFIKDIAFAALFFFLLLSGAVRAAFDGALFAYFRPQLESFIANLPEFIKWWM